jgi:hypothetical protein
MKERALGLLSGGLDSMIAIGLLSGAGYEVESVHFRTGFGRKAYECSAERMADHVVDVGTEFFREVLIDPRFGYGSAMNPCIDCRIYMLRRADELAGRRGIELLFTGEVVGQRSMGQSRAALQRIEREAGVEGRLLRPLWSLARIHGSSRRKQFALAHRLGLDEYPTPAAGCCRLADRGFAARLRDDLAHREKKLLTPDEIGLLGRGRHFRLSWGLKAIFGRDKDESNWLARKSEGSWSCQVADGRGSYGLLLGEGESECRRAAASLAARYSRQRKRDLVEVLFRRGTEEERLRVRPASDRDLERWRL